MLKERIITALLLLPPVLAAIVWAQPWLFDFVVGIALIQLAREFAMLCGLAPTARALFAALVVVFFVGGIASWQWAPLLADNVVLVAVALWLAAPLWLATRHVLPNMVKLVAGLVVLTGTGAALHGLKLVGTDGRWVLAAFVAVWAADIGGYAIGRLFGRHKLAPSISSGKTWEGFAGGVAFVLMCGLGAAHWMIVSADLPRWIALLVVVAVVAVIGDLVESLLKRQAGVKDSGQLLPGHGGLLDRLDSLLAVAPVFFLLGAESGIFGELSRVGL